MRSTLARAARRACLLLAFALPCGAVTLEAQYFGRNNPQYRTFDWEVLRTDHFDIYYYPEGEEGARDAARMAERWYARLSQILGHEFTLRQPLVLYASHPDFQQTNILSSPVGEGTGGVTESFKQRIIMPLGNTAAETDHVIGHELVHAFQYDISGLGRSAGSVDAGGRALATTPLWFIEGMAEYLSLGPVDPHTAMWLRDAALSGELPTLRQLGSDPRIYPYRYGHAVWAYVTGRWGDAAVGQVLRQIAAGAPYEQAMERVLGVTFDQLSEDWQSAVRNAYLPLLAERTEAREEGRPLVTAAERGGELNVAPSLSPDGTRLAFLSERGRTDIELWLADARTGEVIRRLVRGPNLDPHFSSLNFIASAGSFSPDGRELAITALRRGRNVIAIIDVERGGVRREIALGGVPEATNPTWSPDGARIAFAGTEGGTSHLYLVELATGEVRRLTEGRNSDLMPAFSPDGSTLAFVTDRGEGTSLARLTYGPYRIALLDLATGEIRLLPAPDGARSINPAWAPGGESLYFISDRGGIADIYRTELATGALTQVTRIFQGVSGITRLSPALSTAREADRLVFGAFERGGYNLYAIDDPGRLAGTPVLATAAVTEGTPAAGAPPPAAVLPPSPRPQEARFQQVAGYLADPSMGLPSPALAAAWEVRPYHPRLSLDYLGQPMVGFSTGGAYNRGGLYGGVAALWSDMLGNHVLFGGIQAQGELDETGFSAVYLYRPLRWDLGVAAQRIPYVSGGRQQVFDPGEDLIRDQLLLFRTFDTQLQGLAQYAFSQVQRMELSAGVRRIGRDVRIQEVVYDPVRNADGDIVGGANPRFRQSTLGMDGINLAEGSAALVYDNSLFGWTAPLSGQRYRFEVAPTGGDLSFLTALADYRRYLRLEPFTLAARGLHFGRYGLDLEEERMVGQLYVGYPSLLRGYDHGRLRSRCITAIQDGSETSEACTVLDNLFGSRLAVANLELRFPVLGAVVRSGLGFPPVDGFVFYDAGVAWGRGSTPVLARGIQPDLGRRGILSSAGVGGRVNLFGYAVAEVAYVRPFEGDRGWHWQLSLQPGF